MKNGLKTIFMIFCPAMCIIGAIILAGLFAVPNKEVFAMPVSDETEATPEPTPLREPNPYTWDYNARGGNMFYTEKEPTPSIMPYEIHVNKVANCITIYKRNKKGEYKKPVKAMVCSAGYGTPLGTYHSGTKYYWKAMIHGVWAQYATRITDHFLFHSVPYQSHTKNSLISGYYNQLGSTASAGCVRVSCKDAKWLIENCPSGTTVVIYNDAANPGPLGKPKPIRVPYGTAWDPTDPDIRNPWKGEKSRFDGVKSRVIERGTNINLMSRVIAYDYPTGTVTTEGIKISGKFNPNECGTYKITYSFKPSEGKKLKKKIKIRVADTMDPIIEGLPSKIYVKDVSVVTEDDIYKMLSVTDNGRPLANENVTITLNGKKVIVTADDGYGHVVKKKAKMVEDDIAPVMIFKQGNKSIFPVNYVMTEAEARSRISKVADNKAKIAVDAVSISLKTKKNGINIKYVVKDDAGNKTKRTEKVLYEK